MNRIFKAGLFILAVIAASLMSLKGVLIFNGRDFDTVGDYYFEVDPVIINFFTSPGLDFYNSFFSPLMMPFSIELRAFFSLPFYWLGIINASENPVKDIADLDNRYLVGSLILLIFAYGGFFFSIFKNQLEKIHVKNIAAALLTVVLIALNPLVFSAINWGHPEEVLLAALIAAASIMALKKEFVWAAIFTGLALATKQPAVFLFPAIFLFIEAGQRKRFLLVSVSTFLIITIPGIILSFNDFFQTNFLLAGSQDFNIERGFEFFTAFGLRSIAEIGKPIIFLLALLLPLGAALINQDKRSIKISGLKISSIQFVFLVPLIFLSRALFDLGNISYYLLPAGMSLILIDYHLQRNKPESQLRSNLAVMPFVSFAGSALLGLIFWQEILKDLDPMIRGFITSAIVIPAMVYMLIKIFPIKKLRLINKKEIKVLVSAGAILILALGLTHYILNDEDPDLRSETLKPFPLKKIPLALPPGQSGYWLGEEPVDSLKLEKQGLHPKIIFTRYSKKGEITTSFYYGNNLTPANITIETYNKVPAGKKDLIKSCLNKFCLGYKLFEINNLNILLKETKKGGVSSWKSNNWEALVFIDNQLVEIANNGLAVDIKDLIIQLEDIKEADLS